MGCVTGKHQGQFWPSVAECQPLKLWSNTYTRIVRTTKKKLDHHGGHAELAVEILRFPAGPPSAAENQQRRSGPRTPDHSQSPRRAWTPADCCYLVSPRQGSLAASLGAQGQRPHPERKGGPGSDADDGDGAEGSGTGAEGKQNETGIRQRLTRGRKAVNSWCSCGRQESPKVQKVCERRTW